MGFLKCITLAGREVTRETMAAQWCLGAVEKQHYGAYDHPSVWEVAEVNLDCNLWLCALRTLFMHSFLMMPMRYT